MLLAQAGRAASTGPTIDDVLMIFVVFLVVVVVVAYVILCLYLWTLSTALSLCDRRNRTMEPGMVWLNLIPLFNLVWMFITVIKISESLQNEFDDRRLREEGDYGKQLGITYNILNLLGIIPYLGIALSFAGFICFIIYWVKIAGFNSILRRAPDDDNDRRDRRRRDVDDDYRDRRRLDVDDDFGERFRDRDRKRREEEYPDRRDDNERYRDR
jgi:hypothetical protein